MATITITINRTSVLADMRVKNQEEVAAIADDKERYLAEAGTEKTEELQQCISNAALEVTATLRQMLTGYAENNSANDNYATGTIEYKLDVTKRKSPGLAENLASNIHAYIVDSALSKFYTSVSRGELMQVHLARLPQLTAIMENLCFRKYEPKYENDE